MDKIIILLISPLGTTLVLGIAGLLLAQLRRQQAAVICAALALLWITFWSLPVVSHTVQRLVETPALSIEELPQAQAIVILGGGIRPAEWPKGLPDLNEAADRVWHGARLYHAGKAPKVILSGGSDPASCATSEAQAMGEFLHDLGVPDGAIQLEERSRNTRQNADFTGELLRQQGINTILLVTSALHTARALALFTAQGLVVIPAATDSGGRQRFDASDWLPDARALERSGLVIKEVIGRLSGR